ncbi:MAG TPA: lytic transglycosylase domain-containing protein [Ktedonobacterales bacterium]|nr:lytic transglycosylase domain-containing protein [Ktedonobacterales bacterium]
MAQFSFGRALLLVALIWLVLVGGLAATAAWHRSPKAAAAPPRPASPRANANATPPVNCHRGVPPTTSPWLAVARADAQKYGVDVLTFEWQIWQESGFDPNIQNSPAGAEGIAQFEPTTAAGMGIDPRNPRQALDASARLDAEHLKQYATDAQQLVTHYGGEEARYDYGLALSAYNAGPGATSWAWGQAYAAGTRWPDSGPWAWLWRLAGETQRYVPAILGCAL